MRKVDKDTWLTATSNHLSKQAHLICPRTRYGRNPSGITANHTFAGSKTTS